ncbi:hypothetical protein F5148DRAFT_779342 [Russula earlei]|uniref:Uncharacterized protein n=1 Tax=Russula earlei TaxID=71964 RepID=A0ACC0UC08_9AGAM|nr:hypothetical protein F5148DRAFT_779342 [Russula earlei]
MELRRILLCCIAFSRYSTLSPSLTDPARSTHLFILILCLHPPHTLFSKVLFYRFITCNTYPFSHRRRVCLKDSPLSSSLRSRSFRNCVDERRNYGAQSKIGSFGAEIFDDGMVRHRRRIPWLSAGS